MLQPMEETYCFFFFFFFFLESNEDNGECFAIQLENGIYKAKKIQITIEIDNNSVERMKLNCLKI